MTKEEVIKKIGNDINNIMNSEYSALISPLEVAKNILEYVKQIEIELDYNKILLVEDGSVDIDKLEEDGFYVIVYRQGATPPLFLK